MWWTIKVLNIPDLVQFGQAVSKMTMITIANHYRMAMMDTK
jgi:hypothetical protein